MSVLKDEQVCSKWAYLLKMSYSAKNEQLCLNEQLYLKWAAGLSKIQLASNLQISLVSFITVFLVISAPGAFEIEIKHCYFKPAISAFYLVMSN